MSVITLLVDSQAESVETDIVSKGVAAPTRMARFLTREYTATWKLQLKRRQQGHLALRGGGMRRIVAIFAAIVIASASVVVEAQSEQSKPRVYVADAYSDEGGQ